MNKRSEFNTLRKKFNYKLENPCINCGKESKQLHHIVPLADGGRNIDSNIVPICEECHKKIHKHGTGNSEKIKEGLKNSEKQKNRLKILEIYYEDKYVKTCRGLEEATYCVEDILSIEHKGVRSGCYRTLQNKLYGRTETKKSKYSDIKIKEVAKDSCGNEIFSIY